MQIRDSRRTLGAREPAVDPDDRMPSDSRQARQIARRSAWRKTIMAEGAMRIEDIVERFSISLMTAHRDLDELASRGFLRKTRGIVSAAPTSLIEASDIYRASRQCAEKSAIAEAAAAFIESGQAIFFDDFDHRAATRPAYRHAGSADRDHQFGDADERAEGHARSHAAWPWREDFTIGAMRSWAR